MLSRTAQAQVVSVVLIMGISILVISSAYFWGIPLIEKSQTSSDINKAQKLMLVIDDAMSDVAPHGEKRSILLNLDGELKVSEELNSITYSVDTKGANIATINWVPLNDENMVGIEWIGGSEGGSLGIIGSNKDGVLIAKATKSGKGYKNEFRLAYRELENLASCKGNVCDGRLIKITEKGNNIASVGQHTLYIESGETINEEGSSKTGGDLFVTPIYVTIS
jgi:hypothetical protein